MLFAFPFMPPQASSLAGQVDMLYLYLVAVSIFFTVLISALVLFFAVKYRRRSDSDRPGLIHGNVPLEIFWSVVPLAITMTFFVWGSVLFFNVIRAPSDALEIFVVGKQWMWKIQHPEGPREINELHVPVGRAVKLKMTSEDVIHSFFIPAFRIKMDVVPGKYTSVWFKATEPGSYHLFCAEYCGTKHAGMIGQVVVMSEEDYQQWIASGGNSNQSQALEPMEIRGERLFNELRCQTCHLPGATILAPPLNGLYTQPVQLADGRTVIADDAYLRESILNPKAKIVSGYEAVMPTYQNQVSEEDILAIITYLKNMKNHSDATPQVS